jgi:hypothetical protein
MKYRKKPIIVDAFQWFRAHYSKEHSFTDKKDFPEWFDKAKKNGIVWFTNIGSIEYMEIKTLEGTILARNGDYIIKGIRGEIYPCKPKIFEATYEKLI